jgi:cell division protein FtsL
MRAEAYAYHRRVENAWLVRERDRRRARELALVVLVALPVVVALLAYTWLHVKVLDTAYHIDELEGTLRELERRRDALAIEEARHTAPPEIERRAVEELGMRTPTAGRTLRWQELAP